MDKENENILFSTRDITAVYPNNLGLPKALSQFVNQLKLRSSSVKMIRVKPHLPQIKVAYFNIFKLKKAIEEYLVKTEFSTCKERRQNLNTILDLINAKIEKIEEE